MDTRYFNITFFAKIILIVFTQSIFNSCSRKSDPFYIAFNKSQRKFANELIAYYDDFVLSKTDKDIALGDAYVKFLDKTVPDMIEHGNLSYLIPGYEQRDKFLKSLPREDLLEFYYIQDSTYIYNRAEKKMERKYIPFQLGLNTKGKYFYFLELLSDEKEFFKLYYENIAELGTISPSTYALILRDYAKIDFNNKNERLVFIVHFLQIRKEIIREEINQNAP